MSCTGLLVGLLFTLICCTVSFEICSTESKCTVQGCDCSNGLCLNTGALEAGITSCASACGKDQESEACKSCTEKEALNAFNQCSSKKLALCKQDSDCGKSSCSCTALSGTSLSLCANKESFKSSAKNCSSCTDDADCTGSCDPTNSLLGRRVCDDCLIGTKEVVKAFQSCSASSAPCVSTAWLRVNSLTHATIRHAGASPVLCIPGLPCGTPGHLLRSTSGKLLSFREVCRTRSDCIESAMEVSQLRHDMDWSKYQTDDGLFTLTSLSAHPDALPWSSSRIIAIIGDSLNSMRLGKVTNLFARFLHRVDLEQYSAVKCASTK